jgi:hypothetical protein
MSEILRRRVQRGFITVWLGLSIAGALNHTIVKDFIAVDSSLVEWFPHLKYGYVMFNRMPRHVNVVTYKPRKRWSEPGLSIAEMIQTPAPGYKVSRAGLNLVFSPNYLKYLCRNNPLADGAQVNISVFRVRPPATKVKLNRFVCHNGELDERR